MRMGVVVMVLVASLAGCTGGQPAPEARFMDAEVRFSGSMANGTTDTHTLVVPEGAAILVERHAFESPGAWAYRIVDPQGQTVRNSGLFEPPAAFPGPQRATFQEISMQAPPPGEYTVEVGCTEACSYTAAFDFDGGIGGPVAAEQIRSGGDAAFRGATQDGLDEASGFEVPAGTAAIVAETAWWADEAFALRIHDTQGVRRTNIDGELATTGDIRYSPTGGLEEVPAGGWELDVECDGACRYSLTLDFIAG